MHRKLPLSCARRRRRLPCLAAQVHRQDCNTHTHTHRYHRRFQSPSGASRLHTVARASCVHAPMDIVLSIARKFAPASAQWSPEPISPVATLFCGTCNLIVCEHKRKPMPRPLGAHVSLAHKQVVVVVVVMQCSLFDYAARCQSAAGAADAAAAAAVDKPHGADGRRDRL